MRQWELEDSCVGLRFLIQFSSLQPNGLAQENPRIRLRPLREIDPLLPWCTHFLAYGEREAVQERGHIEKERKQEGGRGDGKGETSGRRGLPGQGPLCTGEDGWGQGVAWGMATEVKETHSSPPGVNCLVGRYLTYYQRSTSKELGESEEGSLSSDEQVGKRSVHLVAFKMVLKRWVRFQWVISFLNSGSSISENTGQEGAKASNGRWGSPELAGPAISFPKSSLLCWVRKRTSDFSGAEKRSAKEGEGKSIGFNLGDVEAQSPPLRQGAQSEGHRVLQLELKSRSVFY